MIHHILISNSVSEKRFQYTVQFKIYFSGQGTSWSPTIWNGTNDVIMIALVENNQGMDFENQTRDTIYSLFLDAFLDDTAINITEKGGESPQALTTIMNKVANNYEKYLHIAG